LLRNGASAVVLATEESNETPVFEGLEEAMNTLDSELRLFGKPTTRPYRRMGVTLKYGTNDVKELVEQAQNMAAKIVVK
jgi:phosphoribosylglycinamide formyltransferase 2